MALQGWDKNYREELKIQQEVIESLQQQLMIGRRERPAENPPPGGNPGRPPWPGYPNPMPPGKDWPSAGLRINPNTIMLPKEPAPAETDEDYGEGEIEGYPGWKMAHGEGRGPQPKYHDEYNRELPIPPWMQMDPSGKLIEIPWMKEKYMNEHPEAGLQVSGMDYPPPSELDRWLQLYQRNGGSLRHLDPDLRRLILQRGAMKAEASNNIRRLRDSGHKTEYTGSFRLGDDGKLIPQLGITKADANNIRRLRDSGHQLVIDDENPNRLKIIKQFQPPRA